MDRDKVIDNLKRIGEVIGMNDLELSRKVFDGAGEKSISAYKTRISSYVERLLHEIPDEWFLRGACSASSCSDWQDNGGTMYEAPKHCLDCRNFDKKVYEFRKAYIDKFEMRSIVE